MIYNKHSQINENFDISGSRNGNWLFIWTQIWTTIADRLREENISEDMNEINFRTTVCGIWNQLSGQADA